MGVEALDRVDTMVDRLLPPGLGTETSGGVNIENQICENSSVSA